MPSGAWDGVHVECDCCGDWFKGNRGLAVHQIHCDGTPRSEKGIRVRYRYREKFFAWLGPGPYQCFFCEKEVEFDIVIIHHIDHDRANDDLENLAPCHPGCHTKHHMAKWWVGKTHTPEHRARVAAAKTGLTIPPEVRAKISAAHIGKTLSAEHREAIGRATRGKPKTEEHKRKIAEGHKGKTLSPETRKKISESRKRLFAERRAQKGGDHDGI